MRGSGPRGPTSRSIPASPSDLPPVHDPLHAAIGTVGISQADLVSRHDGHSRLLAVAFDRQQLGGFDDQVLRVVELDLSTRVLREQHAVVGRHPDQIRLVADRDDLAALRLALGVITGTGYSIVRPDGVLQIAASALGA